MAHDVADVDLRVDLGRLSPEFEIFGVTGLFVFGTCVIGTARPDSVVDVFVDPERGLT